MKIYKPQFEPICFVRQGRFGDAPPPYVEKPPNRCVLFAKVALGMKPRPPYLERPPSQPFFCFLAEVTLGMNPPMLRPPSQAYFCFLAEVTLGMNPPMLRPPSQAFLFLRLVQVPHRCFSHPPYFETSFPDSFGQGEADLEGAAQVVGQPGAALGRGDVGGPRQGAGVSQGRVQAQLGHR